MLKELAKMVLEEAKKGIEWANKHKNVTNNHINLTIVLKELTKINLSVTNKHLMPKALNFAKKNAIKINIQVV